MHLVEFIWYQAPTSTDIAEPLNKGNVYITSDSPPSVYEAYFKQFQKDFKLFLKSRFGGTTVGWYHVTYVHW